MDSNSKTVVQSCSHTVMQSYSHAVKQSYSPTVIQSNSHTVTQLNSYTIKQLYSQTVKKHTLKLGYNKLSYKKKLPIIKQFLESMINFQNCFLVITNNNININLISH
jgi:hypothetical protein